jgi:hypothetical protein
VVKSHEAYCQPCVSPVWDRLEQQEPALALVRRLAGPADARWRLEEELVDAHALRVARPRFERLEHAQRHDHGARPVRDFREVKRKPARQEHDELIRTEPDACAERRLQQVPAARLGNPAE